MKKSIATLAAIAALSACSTDSTESGTPAPQEWEWSKCMAQLCENAPNAATSMAAQRAVDEAADACKNQCEAKYRELYPEFTERCDYENGHTCLYCTDAYTGKGFLFLGYGELMGRECPVPVEE